MKFRINFYTWGCKEATATVSAKSFAEARQAFYSTPHAINCMHIVCVEKV